MGGALSLHHAASASATAAATTQPRELTETELSQLRCAELEHDALAAAHALKRNTDLRQVNLFFMETPGVDVSALARMVAKAGGFLLESDSWNADAHARLSRIDATLVSAALQRNSDACKDAIVAGMLLRAMQHIPHSPPPVASGAAVAVADAKHGKKSSEYTAPVRVRVFARSVVEDRFVLAPTLLGAISERSPTSAQQLILGAAQTAWAALEADVSVPHSLWVYVRLNEYALQRRMEELDAATAALFKLYHQNMDREFVTTLGSFAGTHHTVVIEVNAQKLATLDIAHNVLNLLCAHVQLLHEYGFWGRCDASALRTTFYLEKRYLNAGITIAQRCSVSPPEHRPALDAPPAAAVSAPTVSSSTSLPESAVVASASTPALVRTSSSTRSMLRAAKPSGDNMSRSSGSSKYSSGTRLTP